jgi:hypothetical protein
MTVSCRDEADYSSQDYSRKELNYFPERQYMRKIIGVVLVKFWYNFGIVIGGYYLWPIEAFSSVGHYHRSHIIELCYRPHSHGLWGNCCFTCLKIGANDLLLAGSA